jgi:hypothetical protein
MKQSDKIEFIQLRESLSLVDTRLVIAEHLAKNLDPDILGCVGAAVREVDAALRLLEMIEKQEQKGKKA